MSSRQSRGKPKPSVISPKNVSKYATARSEPKRQPQSQPLIDLDGDDDGVEEKEEEIVHYRVQRGTPAPSIPLSSSKQGNKHSSHPSLPPLHPLQTAALTSHPTRGAAPQHHLKEVQVLQKKLATAEARNANLHTAFQQQKTHLHTALRNMTTLLATNHHQVEAALHQAQAAITASLETLVQGHVEFVAPFLGVEDDDGDDDDERKVGAVGGSREEMDMVVEVEVKDGDWTDEEGEVE